MKQIIDRNRINRNALLSNAGSILGMLILLVSVLLPTFLPNFIIPGSVFMVIGLGMAMIGIYYANRWVRKPRPEDILIKALKGLGEGYVLYNYPKFPADHILLSPKDITVIETVAMEGSFSYLNGKWKESMTIGRAIRYIVEEHLGDPTRSAVNSAQLLARRINELDLSKKELKVKSLVVFTNPRALFEVNNPTIPVCHAEKLRKHLETTQGKLPTGDYEKIAQYLESITR